MTTDNNGNLKIRPPVTAKEHQQVQREDKARKILLSALPDEHMEDVNMKFLRGLPPFWSGVALILKIKGGLEYISFDDLYNKLKFLEIDTKGYSSSSSTLSNVAFVSTDGSSQGNLSYQESRNGGHTTTLSVSPAMVVVNGSIDWDKQTEEGSTEPRSLENSGMIAGIKIESDADSEGKLGIDDSKVSIFYTNSDELEGKPIYNRFALVDHIKAVLSPLTGNYMPPSNIPDIDESQMVYGKKPTDSSEIKTNDDSISHSNDSVLFDFSDRSSESSTNDL
nr:ribonuclease H-like domain-containing protein [Tanacetum cinerariifolium]